MKFSIRLPLAGLLLFVAAPVLSAGQNTLAPAGATRLDAATLVAAVIEANPGLAASDALARAARAEVGSAGSLPDPVLTWGLAPNTIGEHGVGTRQQAQISQRFPWPGTLNLESRAAHAEAKAADLDYSDTRLHLAETARSVYADWFYVHRALDINARERVLLMRLRDVAEAKYASGEAPEQDVLSAEVELARIDDEKLRLESRRSQVRARINALLDRAPSTRVSAPAVLRQSAPLPLETVLESDALANHPALQSLEARLEEANDRLGVARKSGFPSFNVFAGYNGVMDPASKRLAIGVGISIPLYRGKYRSDVTAASHRRDATAASLEAVRSGLLAKLASARAAVEQAAGSVALYKGRIVPLATQNMTAAESDYRSGSGDFTKLIDAEKNYLLAQLNLARNQADYFTRLAELDYQSGGALLPIAANQENTHETP